MVPYFCSNFLVLLLLQSVSKSSIETLKSSYQIAPKANLSSKKGDYSFAISKYYNRHSGCITLLNHFLESIESRRLVTAKVPVEYEIPKAINHRSNKKVCPAQKEFSAQIVSHRPVRHCTVLEPRYFKVYYISFCKSIFQV